MAEPTNETANETANTQPEAAPAEPIRLDLAPMIVKALVGVYEDAQKVLYGSVGAVPRAKLDEPFYRLCSEVLFKAACRAEWTADQVSMLQIQPPQG
jgi:hypothetical protein